MPEGPRRGGAGGIGAASVMPAKAGIQYAAAFSPRAVIASEAKQSIAAPKKKMDCFVASLLAMTSLQDTPSHSRGAIRPSFSINVSLGNQRAQATLKRGRRECRMPRAPAASRVDKKHAS